MKTENKKCKEKQKSSLGSTLCKYLRFFDHFSVEISCFNEHSTAKKNLNIQIIFPENTISENWKQNLNI